MSLWTPDGERPIRREPAPPNPPSTGPGGERGAALELTSEQLGELAEMAGVDLSTLSPEDRAEVEAQLMSMAAEMAASQQRLISTPVENVVANHLAGLYELASLHLAQQPPAFAAAAVAIDALAAVVARLEGRLGDNEPALREMLRVAQTQFVRLKEQHSGQANSGHTEGAPASPGSLGPDSIE